MGFLDRFRRGPAPTDISKVDGLAYIDVQVLANLVKHGIDIKAPVHSLFYLYFATKDAADAAAPEVAALGLAVSVREPLQDGKERPFPWGVVGETRERALIPGFLRETLEACAAIAAAHGGDFDGWEAGPADAGLGKSGGSTP